MCELLGMSANVPTDICFSFSGLLERGGRTGPHRDGWGISFYEGNGCRMFHDPQSCADSAIAKLIKQYPIKSNIIISHIRLANRGKVGLENTHPFCRELWGKHWTYAHNGQLKGIKKFALIHFKPVGTTDSEHAFCWIMDQLKLYFNKAPRNSGTLRKFIQKLCNQLNELGTFNILLSDSKHLFAYCSTKLCWISRKAPFGEASLTDAELSVDFGKETTPNDVVSIIATSPLTSNETWHIMEKGDLLCFKQGEIV